MNVSEIIINYEKLILKLQTYCEVKGLISDKEYIDEVFLYDDSGNGTNDSIGIDICTDNSSRVIFINLKTFEDYAK